MCPVNSSRPAKKATVRYGRPDGYFLRTGFNLNPLTPASKDYNSLVSVPAVRQRVGHMCHVRTCVEAPITEASYFTSYRESSAALRGWIKVIDAGIPIAIGVRIIGADGVAPDNTS